MTLIAPSDLMEDPADAVSSGVPGPAPERALRSVPGKRIDEVASRLLAGNPAVLLLGADGLSERGQRAAQQIANATGARLIMESYPAIVPLGGDLPRLERLAYFPDDVMNQLGSSSVLLAGARAPVSYFGYAGKPSQLAQSERLLELASPGEDCALALEQLAERLRGTAGTSSAPPTPSFHCEDSDNLSPIAIAEELALQLPEAAIVSLEGSTLGGPYLQCAHRARRHRVMTNTGGAIGQGLPCAVGAAVAAPDARVICLQSDGSAQYTIQSLWTMAREALNVTVIIGANHRYGILQTELRRSGASLGQPAESVLTQMDSPRVDWIALAKGYGVPGVRTTSPAQFRQALAVGLHTAGPYLIEAQLA